MEAFAAWMIKRLHRTLVRSINRVGRVSIDGSDITEIAALAPRGTGASETVGLFAHWNRLYLYNLVWRPSSLCIIIDRDRESADLLPQGL